MNQVLDAKVFALLQPHKHETLGLPIETVSNVNLMELRKLHIMLDQDSTFNSTIQRPACPYNNGHKPTRNEIEVYKKGFETLGMNDYIGQSGFKFARPLEPNTCLYEAIANYLDSI